MPRPVLAQGEWVSVGPGGGRVTAVVADPVTPGILYAATLDNGVFKSTNDGATWTPARAGLPAQYIGALAINPQLPTTVYAGTSERIYVTTNGGASWAPAESGLPVGGPSAIVVDPQTPTTLYAAVSGAGIFRSADAGATWTAVINGLTNLEIISLAIDPDSPATLYAGSFRARVYKTVDAGATWVTLIDNMHAAPMAIAVDPQTPSRVFIAANGLGSGGVYRSTNGGETWTVVGGAPFMFSVAIDAQTPSRIFAVGRENLDPTERVFASTDGGDTWAFTAWAPKWGFDAVAVDPHAGAVLGTSRGGGGIHRSMDGGTTWASINVGLHAMHAGTVAVDPASPSTIYAGSVLGGTLFRGSGSVATWTEITGSLPGLAVESIAIDPQDSARAYVAAAGSVYRTTDGGATWSLVPDPAAVRSVAIDPATPSTVYAVSDVLYRSVNAGATWAPVPGAPAASQLLFSPHDSAVAYLHGPGLHRTTNGGGTWTDLGLGLPYGVAALAIDPLVPTTLYVGVTSAFAGSFGAFRSTDGGATWVPINSGLTNLGVTSLVFDPHDPSTIYAGTLTPSGSSSDLRTGAGVFRSTDAGHTWAPFGTGLESAGVAVLAIAPSNPSRIYAGTLGQSVFRFEPATPPIGKLSPMKGALGQPTSPTLAWGAAAGATSYEFCIDTSNNGACNGVWTATGSSRSVTVSGLIAGVTYYWQVRALTAGGTIAADFDTWWRFDVGVTPSVNLLRNGDFSAGTTHWLTHATPDPSYLVSNISGGVFQYYRVPPPPGTSNQAVIFQQTGVTLDAGVPIVAQFDLGNSSTARKRVSVLVIDADFSDLSVCTFWLAPNAPLATYQMKTHTTKAWANAAIYFYAATPGADGGFLRVDNVSLAYAPAESSGRTDCVDPTSPAPPGGPPSGTLLGNGDFSAGLAPWSLFGQITHQIAAGVFEFYRPSGAPAGVVFQNTGQAVPANGILTATFALGNTSTVRKRVTVILHDSTFADLSACTFWLPPGQPLAAYAMRTFATQAWSNATLSVYPATVGVDQWIQLDNVTLDRTPGAAIVGTECIEPAATPTASGLFSNTPARTAPDDARAAMMTDDGGVFDVRGVAGVTLSFRSRLTAAGSIGRVEISLDGLTWDAVALVPASDAWEWLDVDLSAFAGHRIALRFVVESATPPTAEAPDIWLIDQLRVRIHR